MSFAARSIPLYGSDPYPNASVALDFVRGYFKAPGASGGSLSAIPGFSYSRTGTEYAQTSSGLLVPFASGVPAVTDLGLQVWEARTNSLKNSADFTTADWAATKLSVTAAAATAPDGTLTGQKLNENTTTAGVHQIIQSITFTAAAWTYSVYVKPAERTWVYIQQDTVPSGSYFNLSGAGSLGSTTGTAPTARSITAVANGWYRISITFTATAVGAGLYIMPATADLTNNYAGTVNSGLYAWGAQAEAGAFAGPYIATTTVAATRGAASASVGGLSVNAGDYTIAAQFVVPPNVANFPTVLTLNDGSASNVMALYIDNTGQLSAAETVGGVSKFNVAYGAVVAGTTIRAAVSRAGGTVKMSVNGAAETTISSAYVSAALNKLLIGVNSTGIGQLNSTLGRGVLYPAAMNTQALTA